MTTLSIQVIHFIATLESNHSRLGESMPVSYQNSQTSKKIERNISKFLGYSVLSGHIIKDSCNFVVVSSSILNFLYECFLRLLLWIVSFPPMQSYGILCLASWTYWEWIFYASRKEMPTWNVSFNPTYVPIKHLHQGQIVGFCNFQKQPSRGVLRGKCCAIKFFFDHIVEAESNFIEITLRYGCSSVNLLHIFRIPFLKNT